MRCAAVIALVLAGGCTDEAPAFTYRVTVDPNTATIALDGQPGLATVTIERPSYEEARDEVRVELVISRDGASATEVLAPGQCEGHAALPLTSETIHLFVIDGALETWRDELECHGADGTGILIVD